MLPDLYVWYMHESPEGVLVKTIQMMGEVKPIPDSGCGFSPVNTALLKRCL